MKSVMTNYTEIKKITFTIQTRDTSFKIMPRNINNKNANYNGSQEVRIND